MEVVPDNPKVEAIRADLDARFPNGVVQITSNDPDRTTYAELLYIQPDVEGSGHAALIVEIDVDRVIEILIRKPLEDAPDGGAFARTTRGLVRFAVVPDDKAQKFRAGLEEG